MTILYFTSNNPDYLQDALLVGFRNLLGNNLIDFPKKTWVYKNNGIDINNFERKEFTFFQILEDIDIYRNKIKQRIINNEFDIIIFSSIHRQINLLKEYYSIIKNKKLVFLDGEDHPSLFGYNGKYWRNPKYWFLPKVHKKHLYFKREYTIETIKYRYYKILPKFLYKKKKLKNVFPISFAFPDSKIISKLPKKEKLFPEHIVDLEIAEKLNKKDKYVFNNEKDYFEDLQKSKYGITTKRSSWDAMRHYEIAANGAVPCFKNLHLKPKNCAPHGLNRSNCIIYKNYDDLMKQINNLNNESYQRLQKKSYKWAIDNSTINRAKQLIKIINEYQK